jgi:hypothetical protein
MHGQKRILAPCLTTSNIFLWRFRCSVGSAMMLMIRRHYVQAGGKRKSDLQGEVLHFQIICNLLATEAGF